MFKKIAYWTITVLVVAATAAAWLAPDLLVDYVLVHVSDETHVGTESRTLLSFLAVAMTVVGLLNSTIDRKTAEYNEKFEPDLDSEPRTESLKAMEAFVEANPAEALPKMDIGECTFAVSDDTYAGAITEEFIKVIDGKGITVFREPDIACQFLDLDDSELNALLSGSKTVLDDFNSRHGTDLTEVELYQDMNESMAHVFELAPEADAVFAGLGMPIEAEPFGMRTVTGKILAFNNYDSAGVYFGVKAATVHGWEKKGRIPTRHKMQEFVKLV